MTRFRSFVVLAALAVLAATLQPVRAEQAKPDAPGGVSVTVKYTGKGSVDATHRLWVWLFTSPDISSGSEPIAEQSLEKNGGTATFPGIGAKEVYVAIAFDEGGGFTGQAPPPPGSPVAFYGAKTTNDKPQPVTPGAKGSISVVLTDADRMQ